MFIFRYVEFHCCKSLSCISILFFTQRQEEEIKIFILNWRFEVLVLCKSPPFLQEFTTTCSSHDNFYIELYNPNHKPSFRSNKIPLIGDIKKFIHINYLIDSIHPCPNTRNNISKNVDAYCLSR